MRAYDTFSPAIPDKEEIPVFSPESVELPSGDATNQNKKKEAKPKINKSKTNSKRGLSLNISFFQKTKNFFQSQTNQWIWGLFFGFFGVYLAISFLSYFVACVSDQSEIANSPIGMAENISNHGGEGGARISEFLINECFGIGSVVIVIWLIAISLKLLIGKPRFKSLNFTIKCLVALITVSLIVGLLTIGLNSSVNWGGYHGRYVNEFVVHFIGWSGAVILCLFLIGCFMAICMRDVIKWIIEKKNQRAERKRIAEQIRQEKLAQERELEEMRRFEDENSISSDNITETPVDPDTMIFEKEESSLYGSLPDFDEFEYVLPEETSLQEKNNDLNEIYPEEKIISDSENYYLASEHGEADAENKPDLLIDSVENSTYNLSQTEDEKDFSIPSDYNLSSSSETESSNIQEETSPDPMIVNVNEISQTNGKRVIISKDKKFDFPYKFPPFELLGEGETRISVDADEQLENQEKIKKTLLNFGIPIVSIEATVGPTVTLYEIIPDKGIRIAKIRTLVDDIALSLAAEGIRIIAPIPGKGTVGIEVANKDKRTVSMSTVLKSKAYQESKFRLPVAIGSTISNEVYIADLAKMPHLLVAGATGQGKSVGLNAIIASLLYSKRPDELKFVMIDPKMVEFSLYAKIENHYLAKIPEMEEAVITDMSKVVATLSSLVVEMENRYLLLKDANVRTVEEYNKKIKEHQLNPADGHRYLPYIVIVVDEFCDLIMSAGKEVEVPIARIAQKARAVGMHAIIATQRPSANVITGVIRANFPARMAFKTSSAIDSKVILDATGAQQLIGRGDMLISNNSPMVRVQCAFIDTPEVEKICDYIARQPYAQGPYELPEPTVSIGESSDSETANIFGDKDPLFDEVARHIVQSNTASTSSLQRRWSIGYNRAGKIMDQMEAAGIVGPSQGGKPRAVLVDSISLESILNS